MRSDRIGAIAREVVRGGLAGSLSGILVAGLGGRLVMRIAALINPAATAELTGNGEVVGAITLNGTLALILFSGLGFGLAAGVVWVIVSPWIPGVGLGRRLLAAVVVVGLGGMFLVRPGNRDFDILGPDPVILALLLGLVAVMGAAIAWLDGPLDRALPRPGPQAPGRAVVYVILALLGALVVVPTIRLYVENPCFCAYPPEMTGFALVGTGAITATWWLWRARTGRMDPPAALVALGRAGLVLAVAFGTISLGRNVLEILAGG